MAVIRIDNTGNGTWYLYDKSDAWKDEVGCENFDEQVVLMDNNDLRECKEASWVKKAQEVLEAIDGTTGYVPLKELSREANKALQYVYESCRSLTSADTYKKVLQILYPKESFQTGTIRGYMQSEWQDYIVKGNVDIARLESLYFGQVADITVSTADEQYSDVLTNDELWSAEETGYVDFFRKRYGIAKEEDMRVFRTCISSCMGWRAVV